MPPLDYPDAGGLIDATLERYGTLARAEIDRHLPDVPSRPYLDELLSDYPARGGKMMRSSLCIAVAAAHGGEPSDAAASAAAIELLHNASLIQDDIQDGSDERRGRPTLHRLHGIPLAMNAGASLTLLSFRPLRDNTARLGSSLAMRIVEETERVAWETAEGQALDLGWTRDNRFDLEDSDYLTMVLKKTCWMSTIHPCRVGALIGSRGKADPDALIRFGFFLGAAFQIHDDVLNVCGDARYGKESCGDILEGKRTLMLMHAYRGSDDAERRRLAQTMSESRERRTTDDVRWVRDLMVAKGSIDHAATIARGLAGAALHEFDEAFAALPHSRDLDFVRALAVWVLDRTR